MVLRTAASAAVCAALSGATSAQGIRGYAWTHQDGTPQNGNQLRAYLNYEGGF